MSVVAFFSFWYQFWATIFSAIYRCFVPVPEKDVKDEIVLITGAGHGMGRLQAIEYSKRGAIVIVADINEKGNQETAEILRKSGGRVHAYTCDVSKRENIKKLAAKIRGDVGDVTILVNNAGVINVADVISLTDEKIQRTFDVNVLAHFWLIREFLPAMKKRNHGHIVALASQAGVSGTPYLTDYCASKFAVVGFCESLRRELRWMNFDGIHVTYICPYFVSTGFVQNPRGNFGAILTPENVVEKLMKAVLTNNPCVHVPNQERSTLYLKSIIPHATYELIYDAVHPECDKVDMKKED